MKSEGGPIGKGFMTMCTNGLPILAITSSYPVVLSPVVVGDGYESGVFEVNLDEKKLLHSMGNTAPDPTMAHVVDHFKVDPMPAWFLSEGSNQWCE